MVEREPSDDERRHQTLQLSDGRSLGWAEFGLNDGPALFVFHGLPGNRLAVEEMWNATPVNVRVVAPDRPGFGLSSFQSGRSFGDWADDVRQLADALEVDRFHVVGFSGGGPHALAVASQLTRRVITVSIISGAGSLDDRESFRELLPSSRLLFTLAKRSPLLLRMAVGAGARALSKKPAVAMERAAASKSLPAADRRAMTDPRLRAINDVAAPESFRQGSRGVLHEVTMNVAPWDFDVAEIECPVLMWHGGADRNVPVAMARRLAGRIQQATLHEFPDEGHLIVPEHWDEIVDGLLSRG
ncbi:MAG TPA: alpha/beta hydrolase [Acidimicrobiales bacterium]|nr:alpha/beta hydrolase [Acidimicrobiales bacterium]